jgi:hypothetical protein
MRCLSMFVALLLLLLAGCAESATDLAARNSAPTARGTTAGEPWGPPLVDLDGRELGPAGDAGVKAIALLFVLSDCPISNAYIPELNRLHQAFSTSGIPLILVHVDEATTPDEARQHAREYKIELPVVLDPDHAWVRKAGASTAPEAAVFSRTGELLYRGRIDNQYAGLGKRRAVVTSHDLRDALNAVLTGQPIGQPRTEAIGCPIPE